MRLSKVVGKLQSKYHSNGDTAFGDQMTPPIIAARYTLFHCRQHTEAARVRIDNIDIHSTSHNIIVAVLWEFYVCLVLFDFALTVVFARIFYD